MTSKDKTENTEQTSPLARWLRVVALAVLNVLILAALAAYFANQRLDLMSALSIIADSMGIVIGLLGVWFFFQSEQLNRESAANLQRTQATVQDLRNQMWDMINKTFTTFMRRQDAADSQAADEALQLLRQEIAKMEKEASSKQQLESAVNTVSRRVESLEGRRGVFGPGMPLGMSHGETGLQEALIEIFLLNPSLTLGELSSALKSRGFDPRTFGSLHWTEIFNDLIDSGHLDTSARSELVDESANMYPGPRLSIPLQRSLDKSRETNDSSSPDQSPPE